MQKARTGWTKKACIVAGVVSGLMLSLSAWAQQGASGIAGVVKDTSGAVLPGVTVEAASPALIEKTRAATTDASGQYKIIDLRPGTYTITFTLPGFNTVRREGLELPANFVAPLNIDMAVGQLEETVTVSGQSPVVDVQTSSVRKTLAGSVLTSLPSTGSTSAYVAMTPGLSLGTGSQDVGGSTGERQNYSAFIHGGRSGDNQLMMEGMPYQNPGGSGRGLYSNPTEAEEVTVELGLNAASSELGGVAFNIVPKEGGNTFKGQLFGNYTGDGWGADNLTDELRQRGLTQGFGIKKIWDGQANYGGPLKTDKLWFFGAFRGWGAHTYLPGLYYNKDPKAWVYVPDIDKGPAVMDDDINSYAARLTLQATQKDKLAMYFNLQDHCHCHWSMETGTISPEATGRTYYTPDWTLQGTWKRPATNKLLFEAGVLMIRYDFIIHPQPDVDPNAIAVTEQSRSLNYRYSTSALGHNYGPQTNMRFATSYVTGSHAFKTGAYLLKSWHWRTVGGLGPGEGEQPHPVSYTFSNGVPISLTQWAHPLSYKGQNKANLGLFVQDQWTINRLTINAGLRFDYINAAAQAISLPAGTFVPARSYPEVPCTPCFSDLSPRFTASFDVFGNGKTALKGGFGRFVLAQTVITNMNPVVASVQSTNRPWNDNLYPVGDPRRGNYVPDCDLLNSAVNGECGVIDNNNFGLNNPRATTFADDARRGFGNRPNNKQASVSLQQELWPGTALNVGYFRTWYGNIQVTDNVLTVPTDFDPYSIKAPVDPRLPDGGGYVINGLYDVNPNRFGQSQTVTTHASHFGESTEVYQGVDLAINVRFPQRGALFSAGTTTGRTVTDRCFVVDSPQALRFCELVNPPAGQTQFKVFGSYFLPWNLQASATWQNLPGPPIQATYAATTAEIAPSLGRPLAGGTRTVLIDLIEPNTMFEKRFNQVDFRLTRSFRLGNKTLKGTFDVYNLTNSSSILDINTRYGPDWLKPNRILAPLFVKFGGEFNF